MADLQLALSETTPDKSDSRCDHQLIVRCASDHGRQAYMINHFYRTTFHTNMQAPDHLQACASPPDGTPVPALSRDGYVRLTFDAFLLAEIEHLCSGIDEDKPSSSGAGASHSSITGYTEWVSHSSPAITIGWDWQLTGMQGAPRLIQVGTPGSNLMFVDRHGNDLGPERTRQLLVDWLGVFNWQSETLRALSI